MREYFDTILAESSGNNPVMYPFLVFSREDKQNLIGFAGYELEFYHQKPFAAEIEYFLIDENWGAGYATEAAAKLVSLCFNTHHVKKINARCQLENKASEKVMKKLGMKKEGTIRRSRPRGNIIYDELKYGLLYEEWNENIRI
ncbi:GNAT family N-acetyltransferase [Brucepastera parasyntrophica]|uniref:GNAT family N-acetyltransferase n=1 Tax=Brucepastera parasyntrophica TaxID=2880008 RepID=UPI003F7030CF|nr:GNAT family N-acetyltransferase [Brucepastera parasyntrophica]